MRNFIVFSSALAVNLLSGAVYFPTLEGTQTGLIQYKGTKDPSRHLKKTLAPFYVNSQGKHRAVASPKLSCCRFIIPVYTQEDSSLSGLHLLLDS